MTPEEQLKANIEAVSFAHKNRCRIVALESAIRTSNQEDDTDVVLAKAERYYSFLTKNDKESNGN